MNKETAIQRRIMLALSRSGCVVFRNECAGAWMGRVIHRDGSTVTLADSRMTVFGLAKGSADIIGIAPDGRFLAVEVKTKTGRVTNEQQKFIDMVNKHGGIAGVARSAGDALALIGAIE